MGYVMSEHGMSIGGMIQQARLDVRCLFGFMARNDCGYGAL